MSPTLQNTAFSTMGLPHTYELKETLHVSECEAALRSPNFGGASVTQPYKRAIIPFLQHISRHARVIGAVNTITPITSPGGGFSGDNTDWRAIKTCIQQSLTPANSVTSATTALVIGAGGTARASLYALHHLGVINIWIFNRTRDKADALAAEFGRLDPMLRIRVLDRLGSGDLGIRPMPTMIVSTIPATNIVAPGAMDVDGAEDGRLVDVGLRTEHLSPAGGVAIELAYERKTTALLTLVQEKRAQGVAWVAVEGIELLLEQGYEQFRIWTGRRAPKKRVRETVLDVYHKSWNGEISRLTS